MANTEISRFPCKELPYVPGSATTPDRTHARNNACDRVAFHVLNRVGIRDFVTFAAQWLARMLPYRRFADILTDPNARLGVDVGCYSFIVMDFHLLFLAGLPAHWAFTTAR